MSKCHCMFPPLPPTILTTVMGLVSRARPTWKAQRSTVDWGPRDLFLLHCLSIVEPFNNEVGLARETIMGHRGTMSGRSNWHWTTWTLKYACTLTVAYYYPTFSTCFHRFFPCKWHLQAYHLWCWVYVVLERRRNVISAFWSRLFQYRPIELWTIKPDLRPEILKRLHHKTFVCSSYIRTALVVPPFNSHFSVHSQKVT